VDEAKNVDEGESFSEDQLEVLNSTGAVTRSMFHHELGLDWWKVLAAVKFEVTVSQVSRSQREQVKRLFFRTIYGALKEDGKLQ
jgi:hypothetical protein